MSTNQETARRQTLSVLEVQLAFATSAQVAGEAVASVQRRSAKYL